MLRVSSVKKKTDKEAIKPRLQQEQRLPSCQMQYHINKFSRRKVILTPIFNLINAYYYYHCRRLHLHQTF